MILFLFCLANCAISFNFAALAAVVPAMSADLQQSENVISQVSAYYMIPYGLCALLYAPLAIRINFRIILTVSMTVYGLLNFFCSTNSSILMLLLSRVLMGISAACVIPLCLISIGSLYEKQKRGRMVGLFFSTSFLASVAGIAVSGLFHWRWLFIIPGLLGLLTAAFLLVFGRGLSELRNAGEVQYLKVLFQPQIQRILVFIFMISFLYHGIHKWLAVYLHRQYDLNQWMISSFFILIALAGVIGQNLGGFITDRKGRYVSCYLGLLILAMSTMGLLGKYSLLILGVLLVLFSVGWTIGHNGVSTVLTDFPDQHRSEIASLNSAIRFVSGGLGFFMGGPLVERNISLTFFGFGVVMLTISVFLKRIIPINS